MHEWNIMCYTFTDNDLEVGSFKDLAKLTSINTQYHNVIIHMIIDTATMGSYLIKIRGNPYMDNMMTIKRLPNQDMSKCETLCHFIQDSVKDAPANRYALILGGHGSGWLLLTEKDSVLPVAKLADILRQCKLPNNKIFDLICFDNCMMSTLESINELRNIAKYVVAYQDYSGWDGIIEPTLIKHFDDPTKSTLEIAKELAKSVIIKTNQKLSDPTNENKPDPTDVSVICMQQIPNIVTWITKNVPLKRPLNNQYCVDPTYWHLQDLMSIVKHSYSDIQEFTDLFNQVVVFYQQSSNKHNPLHHGLSCIVDPEKDTFDTQHTWKLLSLRLIFV